MFFANPRHGPLSAPSPALPWLSCRGDCRGTQTPRYTFRRERPPARTIDLLNPIPFKCSIAAIALGIGALASAEAALKWTLDYTRERKAFGKAVADFQNTRFKLAEMATEIQIGRVFLDRCLELHLQGKLDVPTAAMLKYWGTDLQCKVLDECVQLHGGYGYMWEYPVARAWADARVQRIYAGTNEIMKEIIARSL